MLNRNIQLDFQRQILFKYCFEIDRVPRKEDAHAILVNPSSSNFEQFSLIFTKESILQCLEQDGLDRGSILSLKFYNLEKKCWMDVPDVLTCPMKQDSLGEIDTESTLELLIREGVARDSIADAQHSRRNSLRLSNIQTRQREGSNLQELEREVLSLKDRLTAVEQKLLQQEQQRNLEKVSLEIENQNRMMSSFNLPGQINLPPQSLQEGNGSISEIHTPHLSHQDSKKNFICHQCHSEIFNNQREGSEKKTPGSSKNAGNGDLHKRFKSDNQMGLGKGQRKSNKQNTATDVCNTSLRQTVHYITETNHDHSMISYDHNDTDSHYSYDEPLIRGGSEHQNPTHNSFHENVTPFDKNYSKKQRRMDLAFLYADPLVYKRKNKEKELIAMNQPLDTETEFREIFKIIQSSRKAFLMRKEAVNFESLKQVLAKQPAIIHISCHGDYDETEKEYYLAFEEKDTGILDKLTEKRLKKLLGEDSNHKVQLVFVSACHSELIGQIFRRAKVPVVVAVNSHTMILDEVCQLFARHFYNQILEGYSPRIAFNEAQKVVQGSNIDKNSCCCAHDHKPDCKWIKYAKKHGFENAHEIHAPTSCICNLENNKHYGKCNFFKSFNTSIQEPKQQTTENVEDFNFDEDDIPVGLNEITHLCCCQPNLPHDESIKFIIEGDEDAKDRRIFESRQEGNVIIEADVNQQNKLPSTIDSQLLIGRNKELQTIVEILFSEKKGRLIHIYGTEGVGKSAIAKYSAKYVLERRKFPDGVFYVEVQKSNSGQGLLSKICQKLQLQNMNKEQLCDIIKTSHILIIIDKCKNIIVQGKESFNKTLKYLIENTTYVKLMVITTNKEDIFEQSKYKESFLIDLLTRFNAARLLFQSATGNGQEPPKYLKHIKQFQDLVSHKLFDLISYKPSGILQLVPILHFKSLDQIVELKLQEKTIEETKKQEDDKTKCNEYGEFSWILSMGYRNLESKFKNELNLLYFLCQTPVGLSELDIEYICTEKPNMYGSWKEFLNAIQIESKQKTPSQTETNQITQFRQQIPMMQKAKEIPNKRMFHMVNCNFCDDLQEYLFIPQPIVSEYINNSVLSQQKKISSFNECFRYVAKLSRRLLRSIKYQKKKDFDISLVTGELDIGIWSDTMTQVPVSEEVISQCLVYNSELKFNYNEGNFLAYLDLDVLKQYIVSLDYKDINLYYLDELAVCVSSIFIMLNRYEEAQNLIQKIIKICDYYKLEYNKAKVKTIESSVQLKMKKNNQQIIFMLEQIESKFLDLGKFEGSAEANFLKALALINSINAKLLSVADEPQFVSKFSNNSSSSTNSIHPPLERSNSEDLCMESSSKYKPALMQHNSYQVNKIKSQQETPISREAKEVLGSLKKARKMFRSENSDIGIAKTNIIESEFEIDNNYGTGLNLEFNAVRINELLQEAYLIFKKFGFDSQVARCLRNLSEVAYIQNDEFEAKRYIEEAIKIIKRNQDNHQEALASATLNKILHRIRIKSNNVFVFAKAFPIVEVMSNENPVKMVGTFTRYPSDFRKRIHDEARKLQKVVNLKFDSLKRQNLDYLKSYGCRVLHISSDVYKKDCLCLEGNNGEIEYLPLEEMKNLLKPSIGRLNIDIVVVAIPESLDIAQAIVEIGVPHVIGFDFKQQVLTSTFMDNIYTNPKRYDYIYDFCVEFYKNLISEMTIHQAWQQAKPKLNDSIKKINDKSLSKILRKEELGEGPILFPIDGNHNVKLFNNRASDERMQLKDGLFLDSSRVRGPTNVKREVKPYTGRQIEIYKVLNHLQKSHVKVINIVGLDGIGKTRFVQEVAYYVHARYQYQDGIFLMDLKRAKSAEQIKQKMKDINIGGGGQQSLDLNANLQNKNILLILDNVDSLLKHNKTQFDWWLLSILQQCENIKVILTSKKDMKSRDQPNLEKQVRHVKLRALNDIEAVDMILSHCQREILPEELHLSSDSKRNIHIQLQQEGVVKKCHGFPKYLEIFAKILEITSFDKIDIKNYIKGNKGEKMERYKKEQSNLVSKQKPLSTRKKDNSSNSNSSQSPNYNSNFQASLSDNFLRANNQNYGNFKRSEEKTTSIQIPSSQGGMNSKRKMRKASASDSLHKTTTDSKHPEIIKEEEEEDLEKSSYTVNQNKRQKMLPNNDEDEEKFGKKFRQQRSMNLDEELLDNQDNLQESYYELEDNNNNSNVINTVTLLDDDKNFFYNKNNIANKQNINNNTQLGSQIQNTSNKLNESNTLKKQKTKTKDEESSDGEEDQIKITKYSKYQHPQNLYKSDGGETNQEAINKMIRKSNKERTELLNSAYEEEKTANKNENKQQPISEQLKQDLINGHTFDDLKRNFTVQDMRGYVNPQQQQTYQWGRASVLDKLRNNNNEFGDCEDPTYLLEIPEIGRLDSVISQQFDQVSDSRSRANSDVFCAPENLRNSYQGGEYLRKSIYSKPQQQQKQLQIQSLVEEKVDEENTESKINSDIGDHNMSNQLGVSLFNTEINKKLFDINDANSVHSEEVDEFNDQLQLQIAQQNDELPIMDESHFRKQVSAFTTSSGGRKNESMFSGSSGTKNIDKQNSDNSNFAAHTGNGYRVKGDSQPKSNRQKRKYMKKTQNQLNQVLEKKLEQKKQNKKQDKQLREKQLSKLESVGELLIDDEATKKNQDNEEMKSDNQLFDMADEFETLEKKVTGISKINDQKKSKKDNNSSSKKKKRELSVD